MANVRKLTEEQKRKLRRVAGFTSASLFWYVPNQFKEKDEKGEYVFDKSLWMGFQLSPLTMFEYETLSRVKDQKDDEATETTLNILSQKIKSVKNFYDFNGNEIEFSGVEQLPPMLITELFMALMYNAWLSDEELEGLNF